MKMIRKITNFVLNKLHKNNQTFSGTNKEGSNIRSSRLKKFRNKSKKMILAAQLVAIWYLLILAGSYLTTDTGAYFNDVEKISGTISVSDDYCRDANEAIEFWQKYCKDNAGLVMDLTHLMLIPEHIRTRIIQVIIKAVVMIIQMPLVQMQAK